MTPSAKRSRVGHMAVAMLMAAMLDGPKTYAELCEASGLNQTSVRGYIMALRKFKAARIAEWQTDSRNRLTVAAFALGKGTDAVRKIEPRDNAARLKAYRTRNKQVRMLRAMTEVA